MICSQCGKTALPGTWQGTSDGNSHFDCRLPEATYSQFIRLRTTARDLMEIQNGSAEDAKDLVGFPLTPIEQEVVRDLIEREAMMQLFRVKE